MFAYKGDIVNFMNFNQLIMSPGESVISPDLIDLYQSGANCNIAPTAQFALEVKIGHVESIGAYAQIGDGADISFGVNLGTECIIGMDCKVGSFALLGSRSVMLRDSTLGSMSSVRERVVIGKEVAIPFGSQIDSGMVIPSQETITTLSNFGGKRRVVTIHGSEDGPRFSIGCQDSVSWLRISERINKAIDTVDTSAAHYRKYLDVFNAVGLLVQNAFDADLANGRHDETIAQANALRSATNDF